MEDDVCEALLCLRSCVIHFPAITLYHRQIALPAHDKEAEAWRGEASCPRWRSKQMVKAEFEPRACALKPLCLYYIPSGRALVTDPSSLANFRVEPAFQIMQWGLSVR